VPALPVPCGFALKQEGTPAMAKEKNREREKKLIPAAGTPVPDTRGVVTAGLRGSMLLQDAWYISTSERKNDV